MVSSELFFASVRYISRSCTRPISLGRVLSFAKKDDLAIKEEVKVQVEEDTQKLATHCCGTNLFIEGEDVKLKPDSEYPDWLWSIGFPLPLEKLDKNSKTYWNRVKRMREKEMKYINSLQRNKSVHK